jgi:hypothetical protein
VTDLTEREILSCLRENAKGAADDCILLAKLPAQGPTYKRMRERLKLVEGCCRQMAYWREDGRWLPLGLQVEECHQRTGTWLRMHYPRKLFLKLAENMRTIEKVAEGLETRATGVSGMILPKPLPHTPENRAVQVLVP